MHVEPRFAAVKISKRIFPTRKAHDAKSASILCARSALKDMFFPRVARLKKIRRLDPRRCVVKFCQKNPTIKFVYEKIAFIEYAYAREARKIIGE